jgi:hypothetical protein
MFVSFSTKILKKSIFFLFRSEISGVNRLTGWPDGVIESISSAIRQGGVSQTGACGQTGSDR